ncbi:hypothetical protein GUJ93_ZPchr0005g14277 [Zizania palustris]|uniref:NFD4 C-terminal domain-containing protein n=1 Tax=Zizania palustris TaxID=103762 RepID=A0A8J5S4M2_ZIZPA|nr:hypothetical protein GUJ93_ZPchr0005g14277 [Zizania palustris]
MFAITLATGACAVLGSVGSKSIGLSSKEHMVSLYVLLALPILIPAALKIRETMDKFREAKRENRVHDLATDEPDTAVSVLDVEAENKDKEDERLRRHHRRELRPRRGRSPESRGLSDPSTLVSLSSSFGFFGRLLPAFLDYYTAKSGYSISRTGSMAALMAPMAGAFFLLLGASDMFLYNQHGGGGDVHRRHPRQWRCRRRASLFVQEELRGEPQRAGGKHPVGSLCFGYLAAFLYQKEARGGSRCVGAACYRDTFLLWAPRAPSGRRCAPCSTRGRAAYSPGGGYPPPATMAARTPTVLS